MKAATAKNSSRDAILRAAERVFGALGYHGASMREIAMEAKVAQALLHYHFKTKEALYVAIFEQRSQLINDRRQARLQELRKKGAFDLRAVVEVFALPAPDMFDDPRQNYESYQQMAAAVSVGHDARSVALVKSCYDGISKQFIDAFMAAVPELTKAAATWCYLYALGIRRQAELQTDRAARLSGGKNPSPPAWLVAFIEAGILSIAQTSAGKKKTAKGRAPAKRKPQ